tara:strand:+ start:1395 stop:1727 length:333 start_codon:yes stop_codon:yes gene_type:complete
MNDNEYNNYLVQKGTIRYKFIIVIFLLSIVIFHPETFNLMKKILSIENMNSLLFIHSGLFALIIYSMLYYSNGSFIMSPCNIEIDYNDFIYYQNKNNVSNTINNEESIIY